MKPPEYEKWWTTLYYGARGSGKTLHQAKEVLKTLKYLDALYAKNPDLKRAIVYSIQQFNTEITEKYKDYLYYWNDAQELRYCPREKCWKGKRPHALHGCYLIFDDIATILAADNWTQTPMWLRKRFTQGRHFGIRILANCQDPFSVDINFRRYVDMAFRFRKIMGSNDPDETKPPIKRIWGIYKRYRIKAEFLWAFGDMTPAEIAAFKLKEKERSKITGSSPYRDAWHGSFHKINRKICEIYDTTQNVKEYKPKGYAHYETACTDPDHNHVDKKAINYCGFKKVSHELI